MPAACRVYTMVDILTTFKIMTFYYIFNCFISSVYFVACYIFTCILFLNKGNHQCMVCKWEWLWLNACKKVLYMVQQSYDSCNCMVLNNIVKRITFTISLSNAYEIKAIISFMKLICRPISAYMFSSTVCNGKTIILLFPQ